MQLNLVNQFNPTGTKLDSIDEQCPATEEFGVALVPETGDSVFTATTDDLGEVVLTVPAGRYAIEIDAQPTCLIDSIAVDDDGLLVVEGGEATDATIYRCEAA